MTKAASRIRATARFVIAPLTREAHVLHRRRSAWRGARHGQSSVQRRIARRSARCRSDERSPATHRLHRSSRGIMPARRTVTKLMCATICGALAASMRSGICRYIVDPRCNAGGDMAPMMAGSDAAARARSLAAIGSTTTVAPDASARPRYDAALRWNAGADYGPVPRADSTRPVAAPIDRRPRVLRVRGNSVRGPAQSARLTANHRQATSAATQIYENCRTTGTSPWRRRAPRIAVTARAASPDAAGHRNGIRRCDACCRARLVAQATLHE